MRYLGVIISSGGRSVDVSALSLSKSPCHTPEGNDWDRKGDDSFFHFMVGDVIFFGVKCFLMWHH